MAIAAADGSERHIDTLIFVLDRFCEDFGYDSKKIRRPSVPTEEARWLTWDEYYAPAAARSRTAPARSSDVTRSARATKESSAGS